MATPSPSRRARAFEAAAREPQPGLLHELAAFLVATRKWWLAPIILVLLVLGLLIMLSASAAAPLIYPLF